MSDFAFMESSYLLSILLVLLLLFGSMRIAQFILRRLPLEEHTRVPDLARLLQKPFRAVLTIIGLQLGWRWIDNGNHSWGVHVDHAIQIAFIVALTWLLVAGINVVEAVVVDRFSDSSDPNDVGYRRSITQISLLRRLIVAFVIIIAMAITLMTFSSFRAIGAGLLASAGLISIVVGIAAQSTLGNVFAGLHLAFSNIVKVNDIVVVAGETGQVDEVTLTTVVVYIWNDRRLILPTSYFKEHPFENWTRSGPRIGANIFFDVGFTAPVEKLRTELTRYLPTHPMWDGRQGVLWVSDITGGRMRLRIAVSSASTDNLWGLLNDVREHMVTFLVATSPESLLHFRGEGIYPE